MTDEPAPVVPIAPGVRIRQTRSVQLLEFVTQSLATFEDGEPPVAIAIMIYGAEGGTKLGWMNDHEIGEASLLALAGAQFIHRAATED